MNGNKLEVGSQKFDGIERWQTPRHATVAAASSFWLHSSNLTIEED